MCIKEGNSAFEASNKTGVSRTTGTCIRKAYTTSDKTTLEKLLNPEEHHPSRKPVLFSFEEYPIARSVFEAAERGLAVEDNTINSVRARIFRDRAPHYVTGLPYSDTIRTFRAQNISLAYLVSTNVSYVRLLAQNHNHVTALKISLKKIEEQYSSIFSDRIQIWNRDETAVSGDDGRKVRFFASSYTNSGGSTRSIRDTRKHVTAVIAIAACGNIAHYF